MSSPHRGHQLGARTALEGIVTVEPVESIARRGAGERVVACRTIDHAADVAQKRCEREGRVGELEVLDVDDEVAAIAQFGAVGDEVGISVGIWISWTV